MQHLGILSVDSEENFAGSSNEDELNKSNDQTPVRCLTESQINRLKKNKNHVVFQLGKRFNSEIESQDNEDLRNKDDDSEEIIGIIGEKLIMGSDEKPRVCFFENLKYQMGKRTLRNVAFQLGKRFRDLDNKDQYLDLKNNMVPIKLL